MLRRTQPALDAFTSRLGILASVLTLAACVAASPVSAQQHPTPPPEQTLSEALSAACKEDSNAFSNFLTIDNAIAYRALPEPQRTAFMKRFVLLEEAGRPLLSSGSTGNPVIRCESPSISIEMRLGDAQIRENLAFLPIHIPVPGGPDRTVTLGLVREGGTWKLLSVGLMLLDIPSMAKQWETADLEAREDKAVAGLRAIANAIDTYRRAYGKLPETLESLGPAAAGSISPETAGLIDHDLAAGLVDGYAIRYRIVPPIDDRQEQGSGLTAPFELGATPTEYGKSGRRSFFLDASGILRGTDKHGATASSTDERVGPV